MMWLRKCGQVFRLVFDLLFDFVEDLSRRPGFDIGPQNRSHPSAVFRRRLRESLKLGARRSEKKSGAESDRHQSEDTEHSEEKSRCAPRKPRMVGTLAEYKSPGSGPQKNRGEPRQLGEKATTQKQAAKDKDVNQRQDRSNGCVKEKR